MAIAENASRHGYRSAEQRLGFFEALEIQKGIRVVAGRYEGMFIFLAVEPQPSSVYVSLYL